MTEAVIYRGVAARRHLQCNRNGVPVDLQSEAIAIKACIVTDANAGVVLVPEVLCSAIATNADWINGRVTVEFSSTDTAGLPAAGTVRILVTAYEEDSNGNQVPFETWSARVRVASK